MRSLIEQNIGGAKRKDDKLTLLFLDLDCIAWSRAAYKSRSSSTCAGTIQTQCRHAESLVSKTERTCRRWEE